jgi:glycosyltransferase involved in cell wall biosynthesis
MKITHFHFGTDGGAERFFVHLVRAFEERGLQQTAIIRRNRRWRAEIEQQARIIEHDFRSRTLGRVILPYSVRRLVRREKPTAIMAWMPRASKLMPAVKGPVRICRLGDYPDRLKEFRNVDILVCNTPGIARHVRDNLGWTGGVEVISNFTSQIRVEPLQRALLDTPEDAFVVMAMGRFVKRKGFDTLIAAMASVPGAYLWLCGDGEEADALKQQAQVLGIAARTRFIGWQEDTRPFLAAADTLVMPSAHEPLGNVVLEAWAQNVPAISSRSEGPSWFMRDGDNGLLVDIGDVEGFAAAIRQIMASRTLAGQLSSGGQQTLEAQFSRKAVTDAYLDLFARAN